MSLYFCNECKNAFLPEKTITDGTHLFCKKCNIQLINLGSETGKVSLQAHLEAQQQTDTSALYHNYSLIKSKHYQMPKKDPILLDCESKLKENPINENALFTLAKWYYSRGLNNEAVAIAKQITKINPEFMEAHDFLSQQNTSRKVDSLPENIPTLEDMGINYLNSNNIDQAEAVFKKILEMDSKHPAAQRYMADIFTQKNQFENAIHILNRLSLQFPEDTNILFNLAVACYNANDFSRAKSNLKAAKKLTKDVDYIREINQFLDHIENINQLD